MKGVPILCSTHAIINSTDLGAVICSKYAIINSTPYSYNKLDMFCLKSAYSCNKLDSFLPVKLCYKRLDSYCYNRLDTFQLLNFAIIISLLDLFTINKTVIWPS